MRPAGFEPASVGWKPTILDRSRQWPPYNDDAGSRDLSVLLEIHLEDGQWKACIMLCALCRQSISLITTPGDFHPP